MLLEIKLKIWSLIKYKLKIRSWEHFKAKNYRNFDKVFFKTFFKTSELKSHLEYIGIKKGDTILVHSSWDEFYNYEGSIHDFINCLIGVVGAEGTLVMPSYPLLRKTTSIFDLRRTPTAAGLIAEEFRNYPGVLRSINLHSVCALGPNADYLIADHQFSVTSWDEKSPYYRLGELNAKILSFGMGTRFVGTIMHVADSVLRTKLLYFDQFFQKNRSVVFRLFDDKVITTTTIVSDDNFKLFFTERRHSKIINKYYSRDHFKRTRLSNLTINQYDAKYFINRTIELALKGIVVYTRPDPKEFKFPNQ